jgi:hypothetical protein
MSFPKCSAPVCSFIVQTYIHRHKDTQTSRWIDIQADRQARRKNDGQTDRRRARQTDFEIFAINVLFGSYSIQAGKQADRQVVVGR